MALIFHSFIYMLQTYYTEIYIKLIYIDNLANYPAV